MRKASILVNKMINEEDRDGSYELVTVDGSRKEEVVRRREGSEVEGQREDADSEATLDLALGVEKQNLRRDCARGCGGTR